MYELLFNNEAVAILEQILINLVGNAIKFTERGGITISVSREGETLRIDVTDTGMGIAESQLGAVFEKFTQLQAHGAGKPAGTGLRLAISREYAHLLGGEITVRSTPGAGSTFTLRIPLMYEGAGSADLADGISAD